MLELWRHDIQHNDTQHNDTQHNDIQNNDTQHSDIQHNDIKHNNKLGLPLRSMTLSIMIECCYAECHLCCVSIMLSVADKPIMLSVIMLKEIMMSVIMLNAVMMSVVAPNMHISEYAFIRVNAEKYMGELKRRKFFILNNGRHDNQHNDNQYNDNHRIVLIYYTQLKRYSA
jgi:hypothetical protein